jgi:hypothetical protein
MTLKQWQAFARNVRDRADAVNRSVQDRGWALAASVGIPRCGCSLHNASIDDNLVGWCARNPHRLKVAKRANYLVMQWPASPLADRIIERAWRSVQ